MVAKSNKSSHPAVADILATQLSRRHSSIVIGFHQAVADHLGVNATDLKAVDLAAVSGGTTTAGKIASSTGLTTGAVTFLIDRLEKAEFLTRTRDPLDRRRWTLTITSDAAAKIAALYEPLANDMRTLAESFTPDEREVISRYLRAADDVLIRRTTQLRTQAAQGDSASRE